MSNRLQPGPIPLYRQLSLALRGEIEQGTYKIGDKLPSEAEMTRIYGVSRITIKEAIGELEADGLVTRWHGKGTYVTGPKIEQELIRLTDFVEDMQHVGQKPSSQLLAFEYEEASPIIARALKIASSKEIVRIDRVRLADERPIAYDTTWLPLKYGELLRGIDLAHETIYYVLENRYSIPVVRGVFTITAASANAQRAAQLEIAPGAALLVIQRTSYTRGEEPVYVQERYYRPDRVQYHVALDRHTSEAGGSKVHEFRAIFREQQELTVGE